jgi:cell division protein FtsB
VARPKSRTTRRTSGEAKPLTPAERDRQRRGRIILVGAVLLSVAMMGLWFPFSSLLNQRQATSKLSAQLHSLKSQDEVLKSQEKTLTSPGDVTRLAREQYQLVLPGQRLVQVLPPSGTPTQGNAGQAPYPGDPGLTKPVAPSAIALLPTTTTTKPAPSSAAAKAGSSGGLIQRLISTLAFWRK